MRALYGTAVFASAFLLFLIEPIAAKEILPALGGSSAVWITCLVFFQGMLVLGYLYAHWLGGESFAKGALKAAPSSIHMLLLALAVVVAVAQLGVHPNLNDASRHPVTAIFLDLAWTIGLPFLLLACTSPLLQLWFARREGSAVPYRLFGLSNAGSLLALLLYPVAVEPYLTLGHQKLAWSIGFVVVAILHAVIVRENKPLPRVCAEVAVETAAEVDGDVGAMPDSAVDRDNARTTRRAKWLWFLLPMVAAMQLSAVTRYISENIAAIPLLWILPLAAYLLSFIAAFDAPGLYRRAVIMRFLVVLLAALGYMLTKGDMSLPITINILFFLIEIFISCYFLHAETYALRSKGTSEVTLFYLLIACGGVAGSFFIGIASPLIFNANYDIAISFAATAAAALVVIWSGGGVEAWPQRFLWITATTLMFGLLILMFRSVKYHTVLLTRNFYGSLRVRESHDPPEAVTVRSLQNGAVQHGTQWFAPQFRKNPTTYYSRNSGVGLVLEHCCVTDSGAPRPKTVGVIGLGAGTLAAYGLPGDRFTFYEINPGVQPIARNLFTYIGDSSAQVKVLEGDARITLKNQPAQGYDVLVVDAFSGDAIPIHLLTREAIALYRRHLAPDGVILYHVSNQYLDLAPEVALLAVSQGMRAALIQSPPDDQGALSSTWVLVTKDLAILSQPQIAEAARPIVRRWPLSSWTGTPWPVDG